MCRPAAADIAYLLEATNAFFETDLGPEDLTGAYAGVRPLISSGDSRKSVDISRKAELYETSSGLITITGGKVSHDVAAGWPSSQSIGLARARRREALCRTHEIPLGEPVAPADLARVDGVPQDGSYEALAGRYGHAAGAGARAGIGERHELANGDRGWASRFCLPRLRSAPRCTIRR